MRSARFVLLLFILLSTAAQAQVVRTTDATVIDKQAVSLVSLSLAALMGSAAAPPSTIVESGTLAPFKPNNSNAHSVQIYTENGDKFRWEEDLAGGATVTIINGLIAQSQTASSASSLLTWQVAGKKLENFPILLLSRWLNTGGITLTSAGDATINGQKVTHISVVDYTQRSQPLNPWKRDSHRGEYELYIDPATFLPVRLRYYQATSDTHFLSLAPIDVVYSGFTSVGGMVFPSVLTRYIGKTGLAILQLQVIKPNAPVNDQEFQIQ